MSILPDVIQSVDGYQTYCYVNQAVIDDGQGGRITTWTDGATFDAALTLQTSDSMRIAQAEGVRAIYTVTAPKDVRLPWHTVFRRVSDGQVFIITSEDEKAAPSGSLIKTRIVTAERWELPVNE